jgi:hypothetical protein
MTVYIKHYIKSEADLPKKDGEYFVYVRYHSEDEDCYEYNSWGFDFINKENRIYYPDYWMDHVIFWLEEIELPTDDEIDEQIDKYAFRVPYDGSNEFYDEIALKHYQAGINWLKSKLR